jgi:heavy metal sensor kinase
MPGTQTARSAPPQAWWERMAFVRGLRFRLTLSYVLFFTVLLVAIGLLFGKTLQLEMDDDTRATLEEEWGAAKGYLHFEKSIPIWVADSTDPEEAYIVERLRHVYLLADDKGKVLEHSQTYDSIGLDSPQEITRVLKSPQSEIHVRRDADGIPYMIKVGSIRGDKGRLFFFALGRAIDTNERTVNNFMRQYYFLLMPGAIFVTALLGWALAARAIHPLNLVAAAAQEITSSKLSVKIPRRHANDELDNLIDSFNRMTARLGHSFDQIRQFSTDVSHELRTPLTAIRGQLEVALFTAEKPDQFRDAMVNALEDVEKLSSIVRALLLLSQAESGQLALQKAPLDLADVVADVVDQFQIPAEEKGLRLTATLDPGWLANVDRTQIERLISNLLSNAVKYTPKGGKVHVQVGRDEIEGWIRMVVEDTGVGVPAENLPHIFDRFYRVRNAQTPAVQGLGLGLSFVAWIVSAHGGTIHVESTPGEGTRFTVRLPLSNAPARLTAPEPAATSV